ncbi:MAG: GNAT family N-acetyltransferase [Bacteroidales bacterium]
MIVRLAEVKDNEHIFKIWRACFTDDHVYIANYLKYCLPHTKTWLLGIKDDIYVSCLSVIPSFIIFNNVIYKGGYLYAVGTLPEHRGNSYSKILINAAIEDSRREGLSYLLVKPASEALYQFYIKFSFDKIISKSVSKFITSPIVCPVENSIITSDISVSELYSMREDFFSGTHFLWTKEILNYAIIEAKSRSGSCKKFQKNSKRSGSTLYYIAYPDELKSNKIKILETNAINPAEIKTIISVLMEEYPKIEEFEIESSLRFMDYAGFTIEKSALLYLFNNDLSDFLKHLHLSLPLE